MAVSKSEMVKYFCAAVLCMVVVAAPHAEAAITCGQVSQKLAPCLAYLKSGTGLPTAGCCGGVKSLAGSATTTADRKTACGCLKSLSNSITGLNLGAAAGLPGKCGVNVPYKISPSTDCSTVS
ncbi:unnamed protein product [Cuscuta epithymum]|uniref:Non-specific lipid-transfer protein n=1 Tax=Cuscuta epithymum TaxID=186058 RepID=A0AAV0FGG2_9ASTE|nr:unnamed protein product [Cuscuta epithymum]